MSINSRIMSAALSDPFSVFGMQDPDSAMTRGSHEPPDNAIKVGTVEQLNVGLYSAVVRPAGGGDCVDCMIVAQNIATGFGYSDANVLREGDTVIYCLPSKGRSLGMILARRPDIYAEDDEHQEVIRSDTNMERRSSFLSSDCYRKNSPAYTVPLRNPNDTSTIMCTGNRPTDLVPGEHALLNQHRCGFLGGLYSASLLGGGAQIRLFALENRMRVTADSIQRSTLSGNAYSWHNGRNLSEERMCCLYQEERLGLSSAGASAFDEADYDKDGYFTKNKAKRQTAKPRVIEQTGYYGNLSTRYCVRPDAASEDLPRSMDDRPKDPGVARESIDPSGQYRLATTGMLGFERIGRIPVPVRVNYPWQRDVMASSDSSDARLTPFRHDEKHPYYRQLELADRVAYDLKNSYARVDQPGEETDEFYTPEEEDLEDSLKDVYDPGFTESETVKLRKYDKRRSGIWQGEDGSIVLRDAWGSEIVMIGGNIQISCAGNVQILPGKTALTIAGDDIVQKAQNSVDIQSADRDVRVSAFRNVQVLAGADDDNPGGITLETRGKSSPWDITENDGGEGASTSGIFLKSSGGAVVTDAKDLVLHARKSVHTVARDVDEDGEPQPGSVYVSAKGVYTYGETILSATEASDLILGRSSAVLSGPSAGIIGGSSAYVISGDKYHVPLMLADIGEDIYAELQDGLEEFEEIMSDDEKVSNGYCTERLDKMMFKFRSSAECGTEGSWELSGSDHFTLYEPFWSQVSDKFETLHVEKCAFNDHADVWDSQTGFPWPGEKAAQTARYAKVVGGPANLGEDGLNVRRSDVQDYTTVSEDTLIENYLVRK